MCAGGTLRRQACHHPWAQVQGDTQWLRRQGAQLEYDHETGRIAVQLSSPPAGEPSHVKVKPDNLFFDSDRRDDVPELDEKQPRDWLYREGVDPPAAWSALWLEGCFSVEISFLARRLDKTSRVGRVGAPRLRSVCSSPKRMLRSADAWSAPLLHISDTRAPGRCMNFQTWTLRCYTRLGRGRSRRGRWTIRYYPPKGYCTK